MSWLIELTTTLTWSGREIVRLVWLVMHVVFGTDLDY